LLTRLARKLGELGRLVARRGWLRYCTGVLLTLLGWGAIMVVPPLRNIPFAIFYTVVAVTAWVAGMGPAVLAAFLSAAAVDYFVLPAHSAFLLDAGEGQRVGAFLAVSIVVAGFARRKSQAELEAQGARNQLAALVESSDDAIIGKDAGGTIISWNRGAERLYGYSAAEAIGQPVALVMPPESADEMPRIMARLRRGERIEHFEGERVRKDAKRVAVSLTVSPIRNRKGEVVGASAIARDISERKQAEEVLRQQQERLRAILESITDAFAALDAQWRFTYVNDRALQVMRKSREEVLGRCAWVVFPDLSGSPGEAAFRRAAAEQRPVHFERYYPPHGAWYEIHVYPAPEGLTVFFRDISERKRAEEALAASYQRWQLAQQTARMGAWEWDLGAGKITWSEELEALHGMEAGGFDGRYETWVATVHPEDRERVQREALSAVRELRSYDVEYRAVRPDGSTYWTAARGRVVADASGQPQRLIGVCMDIETRKRSEAALLRAEKLAATGRLAATIAHEINNPLESITNLLFLARTSPENPAQYIALAEEELERVAHISRQTLGFYRDTLAPAPILLAEVAEQVLAVYARKLESKNIRVEKRFRDPGRVFGLAGEIRQVFSNLIANAIDAMSKGGRLTVKVGRARDWKNAGLPGMRIVVADNGCGIAPAHAGNVFEPFFTTKPDVGTGLGLWLTRSLVQKHGGSITLRSSTRAGRSGTVFAVFLPEASQEMPAAQSA